MGHFGRGRRGGRELKSLVFFSRFCQKTANQKFTVFFLRQQKKRQMWKTGTFEKKNCKLKNAAKKKIGRKLHIIFRFFIIGNKKRVDFRIRKKTANRKTGTVVPRENPQGWGFFWAILKKLVLLERKKNPPSKFCFAEIFTEYRKYIRRVFFFLS